MSSCFISDNDFTRVLCKCPDFQQYYFNESIVPCEQGKWGSYQSTGTIEKRTSPIALV